MCLKVILDDLPTHHTFPVNDINTIHIWHFTVNGTTYTLYKDGVLVQTGTFTVPMVQDMLMTEQA